MNVASAEASNDQFLSGRAGGAVHVLQPKSEGFRSGMDAVLLAATIPADAVGALYDLGAGTGAAGFCAAARAPGLSVTLVERDSTMVAHTKAALDLPENTHFAARITSLEADITMPPHMREPAGLRPNSGDWLIANPPFYAADKVRSSPHPHKREAHVLEQGELESWFKLAAMLLKPRGLISLIHTAEALAEVLQLCEGRFGALSIRPVHPRLGKKASRIILTGQKGSRGALTMLPGFIMHGTERHTNQARGILRFGKGFDEVDGETPV